MDTSPACSQFHPHELRKLCKDCWRPKEEHPFSEEDVEEIKNYIREEAEVKPHVQYAWTPSGCPLHRLDEYFKKFPEEEVPRHKSDGQNNRLKRLIFQNPLTDLSIENSRFVDETLGSEMQNYMNNLQEKILKIGVVKEWAKGMGAQCPKCMLIFDSGELVVSTDEKGNQTFHPACFLCFKCQDILGDLIHCSDIDGTVFCLRHYNDSKMKRCHTCDELIFSTQYAMAGTKCYHRDHLLCFQCDQPLTDNKGFEKDSELYCGVCYEERFSRDCAQCSKKISLESRHIVYQDNNYHYECFNCGKCDAPLPDNPFEIVDEQFLCTDCFNAEYAPKCKGCGAVFDQKEKVVKYEEEIYHVPCFKCQHCDESIGTGSFQAHKGRVFCKTCFVHNFGVRCCRCNLTITDDRGIMYNKRPYHENCFTCKKCTTVIASRPFKTVDEEWYCMNCYGEEFCKICHTCNEPILLGAEQDVLYSYQDYRWHADCFVCSNCQNSLAETPFTIKEKLMVCKACLEDNKQTETGEEEMETKTSEEKESPAEEKESSAEEKESSAEEVVT